MFNQYSPYGYPQFGQPAGAFPQAFGQTAPTNTPGMEVVPVPTIQQVEQVGLQPGQRKMVMVQNEPVIAARCADNMGLVTTEYYRLEKFIPGAAAAPQAGEYVTRQEFNSFVDSLRGKKEGAE